MCSHSERLPINHLHFPKINECKQRWLYRDCAELQASLSIHMIFCVIQTQSCEAAFLIYVFLHSTNYETLLLKMLSETLQYIPEKHLKACHYGPTNETPFEWRFAGGPIVAQDSMQLPGMLFSVISVCYHLDLLD